MAEGDDVQLCPDDNTRLQLGSDPAWVRTSRADIDGDDDSEVIYVGKGGLVGWVDLLSAGFIGCGE